MRHEDGEADCRQADCETDRQTGRSMDRHLQAGRHIDRHTDRQRKL